MTELLDCPYCDEKPVELRKGAEACSPKCRKRKERIKKKEKSDDNPEK